MNIAMITARGGSKRIPRKNIKEFCGKPIIAYSIEAAMDSGLFDEVMVSTDCEEIAAVAKQYGACIPFFRSAKTSDDFATTADVLLEVLESYQKQGREFDVFCCLYPTAPFVTAQKLREAMQIFTASHADALIPVTPFSYPPMRGLIVEHNCLKMKWPQYLRARSQDLTPMYHDCGQFYLMKTNTFLKEKTLFCENTVPLIRTELEVQDIDSETDWKLAELKYRLMTDEPNQKP